MKTILYHILCCLGLLLLWSNPSYSQLVAAGPSYTLKWHKNSCSDNAGQPVDINIDITSGLSTLPAYTYELYENTNNSIVIVQGQLTNLLGTINVPAGATNGTIDATFTGLAEYKKSYYVKVYPTANPNSSTTKIILADRSTTHVLSNYTYATNRLFTSVQTGLAMCNSSTHMQVALAAQGGVGNLSYAWTSSTGGSIITASTQNPQMEIYDANNQLHVYSVQISDASGCIKVVDNISYNPPVIPTNISVQVQPFSGSPKCIDVEARIINGQDDLIYHWYHVDGTLHDKTYGANANQAYGLQPEQSYYIEIYSSMGCLLQTLPVFQIPPAINCTVGAISGNPCVGGTANQITLDALFGQAPYTYTMTGITQNTCSSTISNAASSITVSSQMCNGNISSGIAVGCYNVEVTDALGCKFSKKIQVGENINDLELSILTEDEFCDRGNGRAAIEPLDPNYSGPPLHYSFATTPPSPNAGFVQTGNRLDLSNLSAGVYSIKIRLNTGTSTPCERIVNFTIHNHSISIHNTYVTPSCASSPVPHGSIILDVDNDASDYEYTWTGPNGFSASGVGLLALDNLEAGTYTVTIVDPTPGSNCIITHSVIVPPDDLVITADIRDDYCPHMGTGVIGLTVTYGGTNVSNNSTYTWATTTGAFNFGVPTNQYLNNASAGDYTVTVTHGNCTVVRTFNIPVNTSAQLMQMSAGGTYCNGNNGFLSYGLPFTPLSARFVTTVEWGYTPLTGGFPIVLGVSPVPCHLPGAVPNPNGACISTGNTPPSWATISATYGDGLPTGTYTVVFQVREIATGKVCDFKGIQTLNVVTAAPIYNEQIGSTLCDQNGQGEIILTNPTVLPPGLPTPTVQWMNTVTGLTYTGNPVQGLPQGTYNVALNYPTTAYTACDYTTTLTVPDQPLTFSLVSSQNNGCGGQGRIEVTSSLTGTHHPHDYTLYDDASNLLLNQSSTGVFTNLPSGTYRIHLNTGVPNCSVTEIKVTIVDSELEVLSQTNATCGSGGSISLNIPNGGTYLWSNGANASQINGLTPGTYTVTATPTNGQACISTYLITNNPLDITSEVLVHDCASAGDGKITLATNDPNATFSWSNGANGNSINSLAAGQYEVTITGANNSSTGTCVLYKSYTIHDGFNLSIESEDVLCPDEKNATAFAIVTDADAGITQYLWSSNVLSGSAYSPNLTNLKAGTYDLLVTDANGCTATASTTINTPDPLQISNLGVNTTLTCGAQVDIAGGTAPYTVGWQLLQIVTRTDDNGNSYDVTLGGIVEQSTIASTAGTVTQDKLAAGTYNVILTDANGCSIESSVTIDIIPTTTALPTMYFRWNGEPTTAGNNAAGTGEVVDETTLRAKVIADNLATQVKSAMDDFGDALAQNTCDQIDQVNDKTELGYELKYHHYTLYYYNRRGELTRTVPPAGVDFLTTTQVTEHKNVRDNQSTVALTKPLPAHDLVTTYHYDAAGRSIESLSPDAGLVKQAFRSDGLVRFSQDARQKQFGVGVPALNIPAGNERMTYIKYDNLNRVIEQGEMEVPGGNYATYLTGQGATDINDATFPSSSITTKTEWVKTYYSNPHLINGNAVTYHGLNVQEQRYLRNRVSYTEAWNGDGMASTYLNINGNNFVNPNAITTCTYSYDPHGNVEWIRTYVPGLGDNYLRMEYDLISRNVNKVCYNEHAQDGFFHRYAYDEQNRITAVETSIDDLVWDEDARYEYYEHGPLKRKEIGDDKIQGCDYIYTIHGWLKAINHPYLNRYKNSGAGNNATRKQNDPGQDGYAGSIHNDVLKDVWGFALGYYEGDYSRINNAGAFNSTAEAIDYGATPYELYNGNITYWSNGVNQKSSALNQEERLTQRRFSYDNLNRIKSSGLARVDNSQNSQTQLQAYDNRFRTDYTYDANGNLLTLDRRDNSGATIDQLEYTYTPGTNQLQQLQDIDGIQLANNEDIGSQNYEYDARGSIIKITETDANQVIYINWLNTGKVKLVQIDKDNDNDIDQEIEYVYDATGNRVAKLTRTIKNNGKLRLGHIRNTYYARDASGNSMSIYERSHSKNNSLSTNQFEANFKIKEQLIYGSDRVGTLDYLVSLGTGNVASKNALLTIPGLDIGSKLKPAAASSYALGSRLLGQKEYDLSDHLGNVTVQLSDKKAGLQLNNNGNSNLRARVLSYQQYYPFGWNMPERTQKAEKARFGFNNKENDIEWGIQDYGMRLYTDGRNPRFLSVDPIKDKYPELTPYQFASNTPIQAIDLDGLERLDVARIDKDGTAYLTLVGSGDLSITYNGMNVKESSTFYQAVETTLNSNGFVMRGNTLYKLGNASSDIQTNPNSFDPRDIDIDPETGRVLMKVAEVGSRNSFTGGSVQAGVESPVSGTSILIDVSETVTETYLDNIFNFVDIGEKGKAKKDIYDVASKALNADPDKAFTLSGDESFKQNALNRLKSEGVNVEKQYRPELPLGQSIEGTTGAAGEVKYGKVKTRTKTVVKEKEIKIE